MSAQTCVPTWHDCTSLLSKCIRREKTSPKMLPQLWILDLLLVLCFYNSAGSCETCDHVAHNSPISIIAVLLQTIGKRFLQSNSSSSSFHSKPPTSLLLWLPCPWKEKGKCSLLFSQQSPATLVNLSSSWYVEFTVNSPSVKRFLAFHNSKRFPKELNKRGHESKQIWEKKIRASCPTQEYQSIGFMPTQAPLLSFYCCFVQAKAIGILFNTVEKHVC